MFRVERARGRRRQSMCGWVGQSASQCKGFHPCEEDEPRVETSLLLRGGGRRATSLGLSSQLELPSRLPLRLKVVVQLCRPRQLPSREDELCSLLREPKVLLQSLPRAGSGHGGLCIYCPRGRSMC